MPLLVRGPGVPRGVVRAQPIVNIDLAPTFLDMAGLDVRYYTILNFETLRLISPLLTLVDR